MADDAIGQWCYRKGGKSHLIESRIEDRWVTRCGRQLHLVNAAGRLTVTAEPAWQAPICLRCHR